MYTLRVNILFMHLNSNLTPFLLPHYLEVNLSIINMKYPFILAKIYKKHNQLSMKAFYLY